jgi:hypothetical protein
LASQLKLPRSTQKSSAMAEPVKTFELKGHKMGLFKALKDVHDQSKQYEAAGKQWVAGERPSLSQFPGAPVNVEALLRYRNLAQKIAAAGVEAPAVITAISRGETLPSGGISATYEVTIAPADGAPYPAVITQPMMEAAFADVTVGQAVTVRYDPDERTAALIYSW